MGRGGWMLGCSVYLNRNQQDYNLQYLAKLAKLGFQGVFTSLHIPEEDASQYLDLLQKIGQQCQRYHLSLAVDVSGQALEKLGLNILDLAQLKRLGISCIRPDYGIDEVTIAQLSQQMEVALNASTLTEQNLISLKEAGANFQQMEAWHNYYPRPETGLSTEYFRQKNDFLKAAGLKVMAFVPGNLNHRGPLHQGLPTLESHRPLNPFAAFLELVQGYYLDKIYVADPGLTDFSLSQFQHYFKDQTILLRGQKLGGDANMDWPGRQHNRQDPGAYAIRSQEARHFYQGIEIEPQHTIDRPRGAVTVDNRRYQRYQGEVQIVRRDLPADAKVNVLGYIHPDDCAVLDWIEPGQAFEIQWIGGGCYES